MLRLFIVFQGKSHIEKPKNGFGRLLAESFTTNCSLTIKSISLKDRKKSRLLSDLEKLSSTVNLFESVGLAMSFWGRFENPWKTHMLC